MKSYFYRIICFLFAMLLVSAVSCRRGTDGSEGNNGESATPVEAAAIPDTASYCVVFSDLLSTNGGTFFIDGKGEPVSKLKKLRLQDLSRYAVDGDTIMLSGDRRNNSVIFRRGSTKLDTDFLFFNRADCKGVTAFNLRGNDALASINGGFKDGCYSTSLTVQPIGGDVISSYKTDIYTSAVISRNGTLIAAGLDYDGANFSAALIAVDTDTNTVGEKQLYSEFAEFSRGLYYDGSYFFIAYDRSNSRNTVASIDPDSFEVKKKLVLSDDLEVIFAYEDSIYVLGDRGMYRLDTELNSSEKVFDYFRKKTHIDIGYLLDDHVYAFIRNDTRQLKGDKFEYGFMVDIDMNSLEASYTTLAYDKDVDLCEFFLVPTWFMAN